jgi:hypothetical protein
VKKLYHALKITLIGLISLSTLPTSAWAFDIPPPPPPLYQGLILPLFPKNHTIPFTGKGGTSSKKKSNAISTIANGKAQVDKNAQALSLTAPSAQRNQLAKTYVQSFLTYQQLEKKLHIPPNDIAGALAAFICGNFMAMQNIKVSDDQYLTVVNQVRSALSKSQGFSQTSQAQKRQLYEQSAMVGTFMTIAFLSLNEQPNPAVESQFRETAKNNLAFLFKEDTALLTIDDNGMRFQK